MKKIFALLIAAIILAGCSALPNEQIPVSGDAYIRKSIAFFESAGGLVPVTVDVEWGENMPENIVKRLIATGSDHMLEEAELTAPLPYDAEVRVTVNGGIAKVFVDSEIIKSENAAERAAFAISRTLDVLEGIKSVVVTINGETIDCEAADGYTVYFKTYDSGLILPVRRCGEPTAESIFGEMISEPTEAGMMSLFAAETELVGVTAENGMLTVNISLPPETGDERLTRAVAMAAGQIEGVNTVRICAEGKEYIREQVLPPVFGNDIGEKYGETYSSNK